MIYKLVRGWDFLEVGNDVDGMPIGPWDVCCDGPAHLPPPLRFQYNLNPRFFISVLYSQQTVDDFNFNWCNPAQNQQKNRKRRSDDIFGGISLAERTGSQHNLWKRNKHRQFYQNRNIAIQYLVTADEWCWFFAAGQLTWLWLASIYAWLPWYSLHSLVRL